MQSNFWDGSKRFGPAQKILGPVKGQGISNLYQVLVLIAVSGLEKLSTGCTTTMYLEPSTST